MQILAFQPLVKLLTRSKQGRRIVLKPENWQWLENFIGCGFDWKIVNKYGDFVYLKRNSLQFSIRKRRGVRHFSADLEEKFLDRGHSLKISFSTEEGNRQDFLNHFVKSM